MSKLYFVWEFQISVWILKYTWHVYYWQTIIYSLQYCSWFYVWKSDLFRVKQKSPSPNVLIEKILVFIFTSGAIIDLPISSHKKAYSTLVSPAPYSWSGSDSRGMNKFHSPAALATAYQSKINTLLHRLFCWSFDCIKLSR